MGEIVYNTSAAAASGGMADSRAGIGVAAGNREVSSGATVRVFIPQRPHWPGTDGRFDVNSYDYILGTVR